MQKQYMNLEYCQVYQNFTPWLELFEYHPEIFTVAEPLL